MNSQAHMGVALFVVTGDSGVQSCFSNPDEAPHFANSNVGKLHGRYELEWDTLLIGNRDALDEGHFIQKQVLIRPAKSFKGI